MFLYNIAKTFFSKIIILLLNFGLLILTTNILGAEGKGYIALIMADLAIIAIFNNILGGSCIIYQIPKAGVSKLILPAYIWIVLSTLIISFIFSAVLGHNQFFILFILTLFTSFVAFNLSVFVGKENINLFNILSLLLPLLLLIFNLYFFYILKNKSVNAYFLSYLLSQIIVFCISLYFLKPYFIKQEFIFSKSVIINTLSYGWKNELSYFMQFLNYRLTYFFILHYINIASVGLFSVAIALSEAIWILNKSITTVQYAKIVNSNNNKWAILLTKKSAKLSLLATMAIILILIITPAQIFGFVFGSEFKDIKLLIYFLIPGILAMAFSNVLGHYFAATNQMNILIAKSFVGLVFTVVLSFLLIPIYGLNGACIVTSISYLSSSIYIYIKFLKKLK